MPQSKHIKVINARQHNLKNVSIDIPRNKFTVVSGVSGSGKSSLAFDTVYAEGRRRFVESLSSYARQFLERMSKPDVDSITGLPPAIAVEQQKFSKNPRSTVGTNTEIYDYLRVVFGRVGKTICKCGRQVKKDDAQSVAEFLVENYPEDKVYILIDFTPESRKELDEEFDRFKKLGFFRLAFASGREVIDFEDFDIKDFDPEKKYYVLVDRFAVRDEAGAISRLRDSLETGFNFGSGKISINNISRDELYKFSSNYECPDCEIVYAEPEPRLFSFNNPQGACPFCQGFGRTIGINEDLVIPDKSKSIKQVAIKPFKMQGFAKHQRTLVIEAAKRNIPTDVPVRALSEENYKFLWEGGGEYIGIDGFFSQIEEKMYKVHYRVLMSRFRGYTTCKACGGSRLRTSARRVFVGERNIPEIISMPLNAVAEYVESLDLTEREFQTVKPALKELEKRTRLMVDIGLEYLTLSRLSHTLSGGESQRINLSAALGSSLSGALYVLDEPSIGLHPRDTERLLKILFKLKSLGNTIVVVEHDPDIIASADFLIDLGPAAGENGGEIVFSGGLSQMLESEQSVTGRYMSGAETIAIPKKRSLGSGRIITVVGPREHNLKIDRVDIPLGCVVAVTGVSGSGKSTLIRDILHNGIKKMRVGFSGEIGAFEKIEGADQIETIEFVDQSPIGKSSRSTPATYLKIFDSIRSLFAQTQLAKQLGLKPGYFSFNVPGGRCDVCEGEGTVTVDMQFLSDIRLQCEACKGTRYKKEARNVFYKDKSIVDVLNMTVDQAFEFFAGVNKITKKLDTLRRVGLGYLRLGQPSGTLSGGEAQRIKLSNHLDSRNISETLFIFDEPTTGLHLDDISKLLKALRNLSDRGASIIIIEHNLHVIASSDYVIDLGPEAGDYGGELVAAGTPEDIIAERSSHTGRALREFFETL